MLTFLFTLKLLLSARTVLPLLLISTFLLIFISDVYSKIIKNQKTFTLYKPKFGLYICLILVFLYLVTCYQYLSYPSFLDHMEPAVAIRSLLLIIGKPVYESIANSGDLASVYGPYTYIFNSFFLRITSDYILGSKLGGISLTLFSFLFSYIAFRKQYSAELASLGIAFIVFIMLINPLVSFWNRPESIILFGISLMLVGVFDTKRPISFFLVTLGAGIIINAKVIALCYTIPLFLYYVQNRTRKKTLISITSSLIIAFLPFIFHSSFSFVNYLHWLSYATQHVFLWSLFASSICLTIVLYYPFFVFYILNKNQIGKNSRNMFFCFLVSIFIMCLFSSKEGAGMSYIMVFAPIVATISLSILKEFRLKKLTYRPIKLYFISWIVILAVSISSRWNNLQKEFSNIAIHEAVEELKQLDSKYYDHSKVMGVAGDRTYALSFLRPMFFDSSHSSFIDTAALMDLRGAGLPFPKQITLAITNQKYDVIFTPKEEPPFSMLNYYSIQNKIFGETFPKTFKNNYSEVASERYYSVWMANRLR